MVQRKIQTKISRLQDIENVYSAENFNEPFEGHVADNEYVEDIIIFDDMEESTYDVDDSSDETDESIYCALDSSNDIPSFEEEIRSWALKTYQTHQALNVTFNPQ
uniref:Uncharacterized protein n=1 Tax=Anopheles maculatus TaxID=74869 RepID=A0A182SH82_9DIPT